MATVAELWRWITRAAGGGGGGSGGGGGTTLLHFSSKSKLTVLSAFLLFLAVVAASLFAFSLLTPSPSLLSSSPPTSSAVLSWFFLSPSPSSPSNFSLDSSPPPRSPPSPPPSPLQSPPPSPQPSSPPRSLPSPSPSPSPSTSPSSQEGTKKEEATDVTPSGGNGGANSYLPKVGPLFPNSSLTGNSSTDRSSSGGQSPSSLSPLPSTLPSSQEWTKKEEATDVSPSGGNGGANSYLPKVGPLFPNSSLTGNSSTDRSSSGGQSPGEIAMGSRSSSPANVGQVLEEKSGSGGHEKRSSESGPPVEVPAGGSVAAGCNIFDGRWVWDERNEPYYPPDSCPLIDLDFNCHGNGRPDRGFLKWRWQPYGCDIPRLNATDFLGRLRGQRLLFVGDSLNRNMWESLVCILGNVIQNKSRVYEVSGRKQFKTKGRKRRFKTAGYYSFRFADYDCFVDYVRSTFLVREVFLKNANGSDDERLRLDLLDDTAATYHGADVIVFNTGHWWTHEKTSRGIDYYQEGNHVYPVLKVMEAYKKALTTWARWIDKNIDSRKTQVVFRGYSLTHFRGGQWNSGGQCHKETEPIFNQSYLAKYPSKMRALEPILKQMRTPVIYLNISRLTDYRKDGHPSIYRMKYNSVEEQIAAEKSQDCSHWCLPGVPDSWNELLYASLLIAGKGSWKS